MSQSSATSTTESMAAAATNSPHPPTEDDPGKQHLLNGDYSQAKNAWELRLQSIRYALGKLTEEQPTTEADSDSPSPPRDHKDRSHDRLAEYKSMELRTANNLALACLKLQQWDHVLTHSKFVLSEDPLNEKALYRHALALFELARLDEAKLALAAFKTQDPLTARLRQRVAVAIQERNTLGKRMIGSLIKPAPSANKFRNILQRWRLSFSRLLRTAEQLSRRMFRYIFH